MDIETKPILYQGKEVPFDLLEPKEFEDFVYAVLHFVGKTHGISGVIKTASTGDGGFDCFAQRDNDRGRAPGLASYGASQRPVLPALLAARGRRRRKHRSRLQGRRARDLDPEAGQKPAATHSGQSELRTTTGAGRRQRAAGLRPMTRPKHL